MKYYNRTNTCDICGTKFELAPGHPLKEYNINKIWNGRWICKRCKDNPNRDISKDSEYIPKHLLDKYYNRSYCDVCRKDIKIRGLREYDRYEKWTGRWLCDVCHGKYSYHSSNNTMKRLRDSRTGNLDQNCNVTKGARGEELTDLGPKD